MFAVFKKLDWFFKHYWKRYLFAIIALIIASAIGLIPPKLAGYTIDHIQFDTLTSKLLIALILGYLILIVVHYAISFLWDYTLFGGAVILERWTRSKLMSHFLSMTPTFFGKYRTGDLMARSTNDLKAISLTAGFGVLTLVDSSIFMLMIIAMMGFTISWNLTLAALIPLPVMAIVMNKYGAAIHSRFTKAQEAFGEMNNDVLESIRGVRVIRAFVQEKQDAKRFENMTNEVYEKNIEVAKIDALFEPTMKILVGLSYTIGLGYGAMLVFENQMTLGDLVTFNVYLGMLIWPMFAVGELINILQRGNASLDRVNETLDYKADIREARDPFYVNQVSNIEFKDVSFAYPTSSIDQLSHISLHVKQGQTIGVVGKTGAGKTTLFKLLLRQYPGVKGEIKISDVDLHQLSLDQIRSWIGYVPQDQIMFSKSIRENIQFGKGNATDKEIFRVMELAHFLNDIKQLPNGLDTQVGESGVTLSGGQKQRVALARAFIKEPEILILDDSLSAVDGKTESKIIDHLRQVRKSKTTFIAAHRLSAVTHADHIIVLEDGKIAEEGTHEQLLNNNGWYKEQYIQQQLEDGEVE
ncbi:ABC transporter ATP-binding protein [Virgibacillus halodenitrificans]|uniref:Multidrug ABC transporter permease/ATP-binding protein n=1 Tax=Virgibacillus halodenitrificans TaxID=1482 RepID=A0AAC9NK32_VIRHA|nr:ABC transporter transmembrane domain-containing protein [Virgibacillus halodenitrificans]APC47395.1 multidrug ABC transporter permease/ATP-binding protein [Virgibacillus halodenitrificans]MCG1029753.1 ATP-binding cassette domain-containing protein [Virgibacillus halodenitrificans]MEC2160661.1 ABC transporter transmembrane domain-containing protein [Virgibacillus halodenitrificans]